MGFSPWLMPAEEAGSTTSDDACPERQDDDEDEDDWQTPTDPQTHNPPRPSAEFLLDRPPSIGYSLVPVV